MRKTVHTSERKPLLVTTRQARAFINCGDTKFRELRKAGVVKTVTVGRREMVVFASLEALAEPEDATD